MRDIYEHGLPKDKAIPLFSNVILEAITPEDIANSIRVAPKSELILAPAMKLAQTKHAVHALAFRVLKVGPEVNTAIKPGMVAVLINAALNAADTTGQYFVCDHKDLQVVYEAADLN